MLIRPPLVLDADVVSSFAWVRRMDILESLYSGQMVTLPEVVAELEYRKTPHLGAAINESINRSHVTLVRLDPLQPEALEYARLREPGILGPGESAGMAYVRFNGGTLSSNNMRDVLDYCVRNDIALMGTSWIIYDAIQVGVITEPEAETVWRNMIDKGRKIHFTCVADVISNYTTGPGAGRTLQKY